MNASRRRGSNVLKLYLAVTLETLKESRGLTAPLLAVGSGLAFALVGLNIPSGLGDMGNPDGAGSLIGLGGPDGTGSLAGAFSYGGVCLALGVMALALGARTLARDERSGFTDILLSKPASGVAYFAGRFTGLGLRLASILLVTLGVSGLLLQGMEPGDRYFETEAAERFLSGEVEQPLSQPTLLAPHGPAAQWTFAPLRQAKTARAGAAQLESGQTETERMGSGKMKSGPMESGRARAGRAGLQIKLRPRYPHGKALKSALPVQVTVLQADRVLVNRAIILKNRKSLPLSFETRCPERIRVRLAVTGGRNFLEVSGFDCRLVHGEAPPVLALLEAGVSFLPLLLLMLCAALVFSAFVSTGTALLAGTVLTLLVVAGPALRLQLDLMAAGSTPHDCPVCGTQPLGTESTVGMKPPDQTPAVGSRSASRMKPSLGEETAPDRTRIEHTHPSPGPVMIGLVAVAKRVLAWLPDPREGASMEALSGGRLPTGGDLRKPWREALPWLVVLIAIGGLLSGRRRT